jgi:hypothetical protein
MKYAYIDFKSKLVSGSIRTILHHNSVSWTLIAPETGDFILSLPKEIQQIPYDGIIYEDKSISIRV